jgi:hypothetical protein
VEAAVEPVCVGEMAVGYVFGSGAGYAAVLGAEVALGSAARFAVVAAERCA